jgi:hypothetical protein
MNAESVICNILATTRAARAAPPVFVCEAVRLHLGYRLSYVPSVR